MSEDETNAFKDKLLEQILTKLEVVDVRLQRVESRVEQRGFDTKPIWEQALAGIMEVKREVATVKREVAALNRKIDVLSRDMLNLRADQLKTEERVDRL